MPRGSKPQRTKRKSGRPKVVRSSGEQLRNKAADDMLTHASTSDGNRTDDMLTHASTSDDTLKPGHARGRVIQVLGIHWVVQIKEETLRCTVRRSRRHAVTRPVVGDVVEMDRPSGGMRRIIRVLPRQKVLRRATVHRGKTEQAIAANVDQLLVVGSVTHPSLNAGLMDRYLVAAWREGIQPLLCLTKCDLDIDAYAQDIMNSFRELNVTMVKTSVISGDGISKLLSLLEGHTTVFAGLSGVGKTSLARVLLKDDTLRVGQISRATGRGCHVTSSARLFALPDGVPGHIIDLPGQKVFGLSGLTSQDLLRGFPEFERLGHCELPRCAHHLEPGCAITQAVASGTVSRRRLEAFHRIQASIAEQPSDGSLHST